MNLRLLLLSSIFYLLSSVLLPLPSLATCIPFRGSGGAQLPVKCFTDSFKATCDTNSDCKDLINGHTTPPAGSDYIPPGWTAPNTTSSDLRASTCTPFRGTGGGPCPIKCFADNFKACCNTDAECNAIKNGEESPPPGSDYIPPGWTTPNTTSPALCGEGLGVDTAIGCLMAGDPKQFISQLLGWGVGVGGGIAFLMIVFAGFQMVTASGDPKRVQAAKELLTSAIAGLLLIVFSIVLLNLIGFQILKLPGFNVNLLNTP